MSGHVWPVVVVRDGVAVVAFPPIPCLCVQLNGLHRLLVAPKIAQNQHKNTPSKENQKRKFSRALCLSLEILILESSAAGFDLRFGNCG